MAISLATGIPIVAAADALPFPPVSWAYVPHWRGVHLEFDLELWADAAVACEGIEIFGAVATAVELDDDDVDAVVAASDALTVTGHAYVHGDGPVRLTTTDTLPAGLEEDTEYWLGVVDANTIQLYASLDAALAKTSPVAIADAGEGTHTISDVDGATQRPRWLSHGLIGIDLDGVVALTASRGYAVRLGHRPRTLAYALAGTVDGEVSATIYLTRSTKV